MLFFFLCGWVQVAISTGFLRGSMGGGFCWNNVKLLKERVE